MLHKTGQKWYVENLVSFINIFALTYIQVIKACLFSITMYVAKKTNKIEKKDEIIWDDLASPYLISTELNSNIK
jgi:hypothetical protein